jgi:CubicO group peptidase (beta-lactamase class C family)
VNRTEQAWAAPVRALVRRIAVLLLALGVAASCEAASAFPTTDAVLQGFIERGESAGLSVMILVDGHLAHRSAVGSADRETRRPITPRTLFRIASQTKLVTSVAAMKLIETGRLAFDEPLSRYLPAFATSPPPLDAEGGAAPPIRIRDLLTHTSGYSYGREPGLRDAYAAQGLGPAAGLAKGWYLADRDQDICGVADVLAHLPPASSAGRRWIYGYSTDILACVVQKVAGEPFESFVAREILAPLGMRDTAFFLSAADASRLATVYRVDAEGLARLPDGREGQGDLVTGPRRCASGGAGLVATIDDYARLLEMLRRGGELDGRRILSSATVRLLASDAIGALYTDPGLRFGLGVEILDQPGLAGAYGEPGTYGWFGAYGSAYWVDPRSKLVVLLMQQRISDEFPGTMFQRFRAAVYRDLVAHARPSRAGALP